MAKVPIRSVKVVVRSDGLYDVVIHYTDSRGRRGMRSLVLPAEFIKSAVAEFDPDKE